MTELKNDDFGTNFHMQEQFNFLTQMIQNLALTVNKNAQYLQSFAQSQSLHLNQFVDGSLQVLQKASNVEASTADYSLERKIEFNKQLQMKLMIDLSTTQRVHDKAIDELEKKLQPIDRVPLIEQEMAQIRKDNETALKDLMDQCEQFSTKQMVQSEIQRTSQQIKLNTDSINELQTKIAEIDFTTRQTEQRTS